MHLASRRRTPRRRSAPAQPKRHKRVETNPFLRPTSGFEGLIPVNSSEDFFFAGWLSDPDEAAEFLEHGESWQKLASDPRVGVSVSGGFHLLLLLFLLIEPALEMLGLRDVPEEAPIAEKAPLVVFMEEPRVEAPPLVAIPVVPVQPAQPVPAEPPPQAADNRMLIPKAMLAPPQEKIQEFMNDLPFSEGNTEQFYTDEEVKDPGEEGETAKPVEEEPAMVAESGEADTLAEKAEGEEAGNGGTDVEKNVNAQQLGELLFGTPRLRAEARPRSDIRPPEPRPAPGKEGLGGENGAFTDIRRFLAEARFDNPQGGLVANTGNTLYYNDKGANFVPWLRRMLAEVQRNWIVPYSISFNRGHIAVGVSVARDGTIIELRTLVPSGTSGFDNAAVGALRAAQLLPLPSDYPDDRFEIILVFWYNERPYDLFG